jgi:serine/threonine-protein kinase HipA
VSAIGAEGGRPWYPDQCPLGKLTLGSRILIDHQLEVIRRDWDEGCDLVQMAAVDRAYFWRRQFLNPYALEGYTTALV